MDTAVIGIMNQPQTVNRLPIMKYLIEGIGNEARMGNPACLPIF